ncbi:MAG: hypothetical protein RLZ98_3467 [Pseudomonadota bacterium]|jgi:hypothetical protein
MVHGMDNMDDPVAPFTGVRVKSRRDRRLAELEAFVATVEIIETSWVTGVVSAQESMITLSEAWRKVRPPPATPNADDIAWANEEMQKVMQTDEWKATRPT